MPGSNEIFSSSQFIDELEGLARADAQKDFVDRITKGKISIGSRNLLDDTVDLDYTIN